MRLGVSRAVERVYRHWTHKEKHPILNPVAVNILRSEWAV